MVCFVNPMTQTNTLSYQILMQKQSLSYITDLLCICLTATFFLWPTDPCLDKTSLADDRQVGRRFDSCKQDVRNSINSDNTTTAMNSWINYQYVSFRTKTKVYNDKKSKTKKWSKNVCLYTINWQWLLTSNREKNE